jgi:hypothetical protein
MLIYTHNRCAAIQQTVAEEILWPDQVEKKKQLMDVIHHQHVYDIWCTHKHSSSSYQHQI